MSDPVDLSRLQEALGRAFPIFSTGGLSNAMYEARDGEGEGWAVDNDDWESVVAAVRVLLAGQPIQWCEVHNAQASDDGWFADKLHCYEWWWSEAHPETPLLDPYDCSIVDARLVLLKGDG